MQGYPTKSITYLVRFDPGRHPDREARGQPPHLEKLLDQKVLIDYNARRRGALGWREPVKARPDGYLIAGVDILHIILQPLQQTVGTRPTRSCPGC